MRPQSLSDTSTSALLPIDRPSAGSRTMRPSRGAEVIPFSRDEPESAPELLLSIGRPGTDQDHSTEVRDCLRRLLQSQLLVQSDRLCRFLTFAVESTLRGDANSLKEYTIGIEAYGRRPDFDPSQDSIVRTEARRLRTKLDRYYQGEGRNDAIAIEFRPGSYVPTFRVKRPKLSVPFATGDRLHQGDSGAVAIAFLPFEYLPGDGFGESCARGLTDEVTHQLTRAARFRVFSSAAAPTLSGSDPVMNRLAARCMTSDGIVRTEGKRIRITSRLCEADGMHVASWRFDTESTNGELFAALEKIALEIVSSIDLHQTVHFTC